jgi:hypothetical protein
MAMMVWLLPSAEAAQFHVIILITYLISAAQFMHIVAGSVEAFLLVLHGHLGFWHMLAEFHSSPDRQHYWGHGSIRVNRICASDERDLSDHLATFAETLSAHEINRGKSGSQLRSPWS